MAKKNSTTDHPEYIVENNDGTATITLVAPANVGGEKVTTITMREPNVGDIKRARKVKGDEAEQDAFLVGNLCEMSPSDVDALSLRNYARLSEALGLFT